jgi:hypothetical protein
MRARSARLRALAPRGHGIARARLRACRTTRTRAPRTPRCRQRRARRAARWCGLRRCSSTNPQWRECRVDDPPRLAAAAHRGRSASVAAAQAEAGASTARLDTHTPGSDERGPHWALQGAQAGREPRCAPPAAPPARECQRAQRVGARAPSGPRRAACAPDPARAAAKLGACVRGPGPRCGPGRRRTPCATASGREPVTTPLDVGASAAQLATEGPSPSSHLSTRMQSRCSGPT